MDSDNLSKIKWYQCKSIDELKAMGQWLDVIKIINHDISTHLSADVDNWASLWENIEKIREIFLRNDVVCDGAYFISEQHEVVFYLVKLEGEQRQKALGITKLHYKNKEIAKKWHKKMTMKLHSDRCKHPHTQAAWDQMEVLYAEMTK